MTNFHDPKVVQADALAFIKLLHVMGGIYIWEYFTTLWFEWKLSRERGNIAGQYGLYSGCRLTALVAVIAIFVGFDSDATQPLNCKVWLTFVYFFAYLAFVLASALIVLRIVAIWERRVIVTTIAISAWLVTISFYVRNTVMAASVWSSTAQTCLVLHTEGTKGPVTVTLVEDFVLLILLLSGLRRHREKATFGLWRLLYHQGLFWVALVTVAEIPPTVRDTLNFSLIIMAIGASRIYRRLADYTCMVELVDFKSPEAESDASVRRLSAIAAEPLSVSRPGVGLP